MRGLSLAALLTLSCGTRAWVGDDVEQSWRLHETRAFHASLDAVSSARGEAGGDFLVALPVGVDRQEVTLAASEALVVGRKATVSDKASRNVASAFGVVVSLGRLSLGSDARVGPAYALGRDPPVAAPGARIDGYAKIAMTPKVPLAASRGTFVLLDPAVETFRWSVDFGPAARLGGETVADEQARELAPCSSGPTSVRAGAKLRLHGGDYVFDSLEVLQGGTLEIDNTTRPVRIWVRHSLVWSGSVVRFANVSNVMLGYWGDAPPLIASPLDVTFIAPYATIELPRLKEAHHGSFFARSIVVDEGATVEHVPFRSEEAVPGLAEAVCETCRARSRLSRDRCNGDFDWHTGQISSDVGACLMSCGSGATVGADGCRALCRAAPERSLAIAREGLRGCTDELREDDDVCERQYGYQAGTCSALGYTQRPRGLQGVSEGR